MRLLNSFYFGAKNAVRRFLKDEKGDVNVVSIVILIGVALILAMVFKEAISELITNLIDGITNKANTDLELPAGEGGGGN